MSLIRIVVFFAATLLLGGGYIASQAAFLASTHTITANATAEYATRVDAPTVRVLALLILAACVVLSLVPQGEEGAD